MIKLVIRVMRLLLSQYLRLSGINQLQIILLMKYSLQQQIQFNRNIFGKIYCRCIEGSLYLLISLYNHLSGEKSGCLRITLYHYLAGQTNKCLLPFTTIWLVRQINAYYPLPLSGWSDK